MFLSFIKRQGCLSCNEEIVNAHFLFNSIQLKIYLQTIFSFYFVKNCFHTFYVHPGHHMKSVIIAFAIAFLTFTAVEGYRWFSPIRAKLIASKVSNNIDIYT